VYGPVRTVVWEGRSREAPPYPDRSDFVLWPVATKIHVSLYVRDPGKSRPILLSVSVSRFDSSETLVRAQRNAYMRTVKALVRQAGFEGLLVPDDLGGCVTGSS